MRNYMIGVAIIFTIVALVHLARLVSGWGAEIADWYVPMWVSVVSVIVAGLLAGAGFHFAGKMTHA